MDRHFPTKERDYQDSKTLDDVLGEATYKTKQLGTRKATSPFFSQIIEFQSAPGPLVADWSTARSSTVHARTREIFVEVGKEALK